MKIDCATILETAEFIYEFVKRGMTFSVHGSKETGYTIILTGGY